MGRPTIFSQETADKVCDGLASGLSLRAVCSDDGMPNEATVRLWSRTNPEFNTQYIRARDEQAQVHAESIVEISDDLDIPPEHKRLMIDARKWTASKLLPKKYGDKIDVTSGGKAIKGYAVIDPRTNVFSGEES
jgi:hypothetical protein